MILKNTKQNDNYVEIGSKCATFYILMFLIFLITFVNSDIGLLDLTKLSNLFQIKDPRKWAELVP